MYHGGTRNKLTELFDWQVLGLSHSALNTRDLALFRPLRKKLRNRSVVDLPVLVYVFMGRNSLDYEDSVRLATSREVTLEN